MSKKAGALKRRLESRGHRAVRVWWEPLGRAMEMCGPSGGWFCESEQTNGPEPLGVCHPEALFAVENYVWLDFRREEKSAPQDSRDAQYERECDMKPQNNLGF